MSLAIRKYLRLSGVPQLVRGFSSVAPLLAAIFAPLAVLFDILGLCVRLNQVVWRPLSHSSLRLFRKNGIPREA